MQENSESEDEFELATMPDGLLTNSESDYFNCLDIN